MKTKNKIVVIVEIAIVLCSLFLVALPVVAAEQNQGMQKVSATASEVTTASEDDYVLGIYGNANEDDTIDMGDVVYTKLAIFGKKPKTELCDAKYDGRINVLDVIQTKLIILGKEKELTFVDSADRIVTVKKPIERVVTGTAHLETLRSLGVEKDMIVGVTRWTGTGVEFFFREFSDVVVVGGPWTLDIEKVLSLDPDVVTLYPSSMHDATCDALESAGITVLRFQVSRPDPSIYPEVKRLGYIFDKVKEAEEFIDWYENILNTIKEKVDEIPEEDKPKVYFETSKPYTIYSTLAYIEATGGKDIFADQPGGYVSVDPEEVIVRNPDIIVKTALGTCGGYDRDADGTAEIEAIREEIMSRSELQGVKAVKEGSVYINTPHLLCWGRGAGSRQFLQIAYQAKWFHPELFEDLDPKAIHQEYLTRFQGLDIDLDEKGVFVYPEPS